MRPRFQLSSMNRRIDVWSVIWWSMKLTFAYGDITNNGNLVGNQNTNGNHFLSSGKELVKNMQQITFNMVPLEKLC